MTVPRQSDDERALRDAVRAHFPSALVHRQSTDIVRMLMQLDDNDDGELQRSEAPPRFNAQAFQFIDADRDGGLDSAELERVLALRDRFRDGGTEAELAETLVSFLDRSGDQRLDEAEVPPQLSGLAFRWADSNGDEGLDLVELRQVMKFRVQWNSKTGGSTSSPANDSWQLTDIAGTVHRPFDDEETRAIALVFVSTDCPIANSYQPLLQRLADRFGSQGVRFFMIYPSRSTTVEQARKHAEEYRISVPVVVDAQLSIAGRVGATVTPQVFVYTANEAKAVYQGRIDNLYAGYGKKRSVASSHDLLDALQALVAGRAVPSARTDAIGCLIDYPDKAHLTEDKDSGPLTGSEQGR
jgi:Ca2+-binding EF-hand superfamily protein